MALTKRQKQVLDFLVGFLNKRGYSPSYEEMAKSLGLASLATVHKHLTTLERKGFIRRGHNRSRSVEIIHLPRPVREEVLGRQTIELPLVGRIAAGQPLEAVEQREAISLGDFSRGRNTYVLQVKGNSMRDDHILDGDYIVVEQTQVANTAEIVVAPPLCPLAVSSYDFSHTGSLIDRAAAATAEWLGDGGLSRREIPRALRPHSHRPVHE